jgi:hypothetical protein
VSVDPLTTATLLAPASATYTVEAGAARATASEVVISAVVNNASAPARRPTSCAGRRRPVNRPGRALAGRTSFHTTSPLLRASTSWTLSCSCFGGFVSTGSAGAPAARGAGRLSCGPLELVHSGRRPKPACCAETTVRRRRPAMRGMSHPSSLLEYSTFRKSDAGAPRSATEMA